MKRSEPNIFRHEAGVKAALSMKRQADLSLVSRVRREKKINFRSWGSRRDMANAWDFQMWQLHPRNSDASKQTSLRIKTKMQVSAILFGLSYTSLWRKRLFLSHKYLYFSIQKHACIKQFNGHIRIQQITQNWKSLLLLKPNKTFHPPFSPWMFL